MKAINKIGKIFTGVAVLSMLVSCSDYLNTVPKGEKIPTTFEDYNSFIRYYENHFYDNMQQLCLMNDFFKTEANLNSYELVRINYMWDEAADRKVQDNAQMYSSNSAIYYYGYQAIAHWNLIIEDANKLTECTQAQKEMLRAQAKVLRAMAYFHQANYFADQYTKENAATTRGIPLITASGVAAPSPQVSLQELYSFLLNDITEGDLNALPLIGETLFHPTRAAGYGMLARIYLQVSDYENALKYAQKALDLNSNLYDWRPYYLANKAKYDDPKDYSTSYPVVTNPEYYTFAFSSSASQGWGLSSGTFAISPERASLFETGDLRIITKWKYREYETGNRHVGIRNDRFNGGGISSPEMYYIKAECLARSGKYQEAMDVVNKVRETRFRTEDYKPLTASSTEEAVAKIVKDKANEYLQTAIPFWDMRRLNKDPKYATTLTKTVKGVIYTLKPDSHLWIMPFAEKVINNPGNNPIEQNTPR